MDSLKKKIWTYFSYLLTPFLLIVSTANDTYLRNQADLGYNPSVLTPYVIVAFAVAFAVIWMFEKGLAARKKLRDFLISFYLVLGPIYYFYLYIKTIIPTIGRPISLILFFLASSAAVIFIYKKADKKALKRMAAVVTMTLFVFEIYNFSSRFISDPRVGYTKAKTSAAQEKMQQDQDNMVRQDLTPVYHVILDEYQTDMFGETLTEKVRSQLGGFTYFPKNITVYGRTAMSLSSLFLGRPYNFDQTQVDYQKQAYSSDQSLLAVLKNGGYQIDALIHHYHSFPQPLLKGYVTHRNNLKGRLVFDYTKTFFMLWFYKNFPSVLSEAFLPYDYYIKLKHNNLLRDDQPIESAKSFENFITDIDHFKDDGKYHFLHLIIPHFPEVLEPDCTFSNPPEKTGPLAQSQCATKLMTDFLQKLKDQGLYEKALIVIQADHGSRYEIRDGEFVNIEEGSNYKIPYSQTRSRAMLLIKPPGLGVEAPFVVSDLESQITDIAPTITGLLGFETPLTFEGYNLFDPQNFSNIQNRTRYYYYFDRKNAEEESETFTQYRVEDDMSVEKLKEIETYK